MNNTIENDFFGFPKVKWLQYTGKVVNFWQSYWKNKRWPFFGTQCRVFRDAGYESYDHLSHFTSGNAEIYGHLANVHVFSDFDICSQWFSNLRQHSKPEQAVGHFLWQVMWVMCKRIRWHLTRDQAILVVLKGYKNKLLSEYNLQLFVLRLLHVK